MKLAVDVSYRGDEAIAAAVLFEDWGDAAPAAERIVRVGNPDAYVPGQLYRRELPAILELLRELGDLLETIVVDGYVVLGADRKPGLGKHLYDSLTGRTGVIGVAKNPFKDTPAECRVLRGRSRRPLYVTAAGLPLEEAKRHVLSMHGADRIPTLLKRVDRMCRSASRTPD